jgi:hypothetical protein
MRTQPASRTPPPITHTGQGPISRAIKPGARFAAELAGMCAVMCIGGTLLSLAAFAAAKGLGHPDLARQAPELSVLIITACLALPMAIYMTVRRHPLRHNMLMTGSTIAVGAAVIGLLWSGAIAASSLPTSHALFGLVCGPACVFMVAEMLLSFGMYSGRSRR